MEIIENIKEQNERQWDAFWADYIKWWKKKEKAQRTLKSEYRHKKCLLKALYRR